MKDSRIVGSFMEAAIKTTLNFLIEQNSPLEYVKKKVNHICNIVDLSVCILTEDDAFLEKMKLTRKNYWYTKRNCFSNFF